MIINPFTPAIMATEPNAFFGRGDELKVLARAVQQGFVVIQGPVGIGKSSLLSRTLLHLDGFMSDEKCTTILTVGHSDILTVDDAARLVLEELVQVDEMHMKISIGISSFASYESSEVYSYFKAGRHLAALEKIIRDKAFKEVMSDNRLLVIAIDEADKCPLPVAKLLRTVSTKTQLEGLTNIRFVLAGVSPFYSALISEDDGVARFIYRTINLGPLLPNESRQLLDTKFNLVARCARDQGIDLQIHPHVIERIDKLAGGHPHLLQLLGSHVIEHEYQDPDGIIDEHDLVDSLRAICYESRGPVYDSVITRMKELGIYSTFKMCVEMAGGRFPGLMSKSEAINQRGLDSEELQLLVDLSILSYEDQNTYRILDEFLRIRVILDSEDQMVSELEDFIITDSSLIDFEELDFDESA